MPTETDPTVMLLRSFFLSTMAGQYEAVMRRAEKEGWSHREALHHLCESEAADRGQRRTARLLADSGLPETKKLSTLDEKLLPAKVRRQLPALIGRYWIPSSRPSKIWLDISISTLLLARRGNDIVESVCIGSNPPTRETGLSPLCH